MLRRRDLVSEMGLLLMQTNKYSKSVVPSPTIKMKIAINGQNVPCLKFIGQMNEEGIG